jgi:hypothetical protein
MSKRPKVSIADDPATWNQPASTDNQAEAQPEVPRRQQQPAAPAPGYHGLRRTRRPRMGSSRGKPRMGTR